MAEVLIGCKLPNGIILELINYPPEDVAKQLRQPLPAGPRVTLKGSNSLRAPGSRASQPTHDYAITRVDKAFWDAWIARPANKAMPFIVNGFVFVAPNEKDAKAMASERRPERTGMEPLAQENDPRLPKSKNPNTNVEADPESLKPRDPDARPTA